MSNDYTELMKPKIRGFCEILNSCQWQVSQCIQSEPWTLQNLNTCLDSEGSLWEDDRCLMVWTAHLYLWNEKFRPS